ncbi:YsnF/AvaK domain-containing protein [Deinococcus radiodurans]|jgi:Uncharacterized protein conserved in bacteria|uniref:DUF2382 domain-containing protein n=1 Tax=Deinococcus radiodurans (strain ATCC 13939 / DSM 20539 / JCM 16871 / CCUG 27074 / LMG 4051 / NBRC 15346 / NCIMB 9279 / VKM B-1422 / R1) TaxID=243230 RepID=Q9RUR7_DEIRA|nr:YsnF/AvaK domain-containing protein [Deinococcus radiodurans]AAF10891.1 hypothetical protein DR_1315 [Deinococcus radiodurans R1 = ATCC 13939 = DSM 20539]ANC71528.1 hypothetical protein A2G07_06945 [Deinococcus radiodurans R1 = ATCC 13939 = DSM 20539]QEM70783.1 DUF2382 domain-containing protein [Deinococcus radiodurans]QIP29359.1 YsnF/AvaK domain-containing protein [Deinococcus radiodurans]QIP31945.1 YsnF/AvaK domain-containing protein [Deinococcus radiodurans]
MTRRDNEERVLHAATDTEQSQVTDLRQNVSATPLTDAEVGRLQLLEERATVQVERQGIGQVQVRKVVRERQEMVPVTLTTEVLEIVVTPAAQGTGAQNVGDTQTAAASAAGTTGNGGVSQVLIDGKPLEAGQTYEIPLTEERVQVMRQVVPLSEVVVRRQAQATTHEETVTLRREELEVLDEQGLARIVDEGAAEGTVTGVNTTGTDQRR